LVEVYRLGLSWSYRPPRGRQRQAVQVRYHEQSKSLREERALVARDPFAIEGLIKAWTIIEWVADLPQPSIFGLPTFWRSPYVLCYHYLLD
jgi:hypothetical protein